MVEIIGVLFIIIMLAPALLVLACLFMLVLSSVGMIFTLIASLFQDTPQDIKEFMKHQTLRDQAELEQYMERRWFVEEYKWRNQKPIYRQIT